MSDHSQHRVYDRDCDICTAQEAAANAWENNKLLEKRLALLEAVAGAARRSRGLFLPRILHGDREHQQWLRDMVEQVFAPLDAAFAALDAPPATERDEKGEG